MYSDALSPIAALLATLFPFLIVLTGQIISGVLSHKLAVKKGYTGYFWTGFFLSLLGLIYVVGLPMQSDDLSQRT